MQYSRDTVVNTLHFLSTDFVAALEELNLKYRHANYDLNLKEYDKVKTDDLQYSHSTLEHSAFKPFHTHNAPAQVLVTSYEFPA